MTKRLLTVLLALSAQASFACNDGAGGDDAYKFLGKATASREAGEPQDQEVIEGCGGELIYAPKAVETKPAQDGPKNPAKSFEIKAAKAAFDAAKKKPKLEDGNWVLQARGETYGGQTSGTYDREYLLNKAGEPGAIFILGKGNPYVAPQKFVAHLQALSFERGNSSEALPIAEDERSILLSETVKSERGKEERSYACRLVDDRHMLCEMTAKVFVMGFAGTYAEVKDEAYTAYYGLERVRPVK